MDEQEIRSRVSAMMPEILADLERLVAIPSVAFPGLSAGARARDGRRDPRDVQGRRVLERVPPGGADRLPAGLRGDPRSGRLARRDAVRPLRRPARAAGAGVDHGPLGADAQGRPDLRPGCCRRQGGPRDPYRDAQGLRRQASLHGEADRRGHGGDEQQPGGLRRRASRAVRGRRLHRLRHGQPPGR